MRFGANDNADASSVEDRRGFPGGRIGIAGGGLGIVGAIVVMLFRALGGGDIESPSTDRGGPTSSTQTTSSKLEGSCEGVTSASDQAKFIACVETNVQRFWRDELARSNRSYETSKLVLFTDRTTSGCGGASAAMGPFYCPTDSKVYLDLGFFHDMKTRLGAEGGDFAEAYVVAHEYGHHVQDLLGTSQKVHEEMQRRPREANAISVKLELQADCYAGVWGHSAYGSGKVSRDEIGQALDAASAVGDDRIQKRARGRVDTESFTHGSSAERQKWFETGMKTGDPQACNTFGS